MRATDLKKRYSKMWDEVHGAVRSDSLQIRGMITPKVADRIAHNAAFSATLAHHKRIGCKKGATETIVAALQRVYGGRHIKNAHQVYGYAAEAISDALSTVALGPVSFQEAFKVFVKELRRDKGLYRTYKANIAMAYQDCAHWEKSRDSVAKRHTIGNRAAEHFLQLLLKPSVRASKRAATALQNQN